jgi:hypothetical protein
MPSEISWKSGDVFELLDAIKSGMTLSHERDLLTCSFDSKLHDVGYKKSS